MRRRVSGSEQCLPPRAYRGQLQEFIRIGSGGKVESWVSIGSSPWSLDVTRYENRIPFISSPPKAVLRNNRSVLGLLTVLFLICFLRVQLKRTQI